MGSSPYLPGNNNDFLDLSNAGVYECIFQVHRMPLWR